MFLEWAEIDGFNPVLVFILLCFALTETILHLSNWLEIGKSQTCYLKLVRPSSSAPPPPKKNPGYWSQCISWWVSSIIGIEKPAWGPYGCIATMVTCQRGKYHEERAKNMKDCSCFSVVFEQNCVKCFFTHNSSTSCCYIYSYSLCIIYWAVDNFRFALQNIKYIWINSNSENLEIRVKLWIYKKSDLKIRWLIL